MPSDIILYEHPTDAAMKYYLPRYRLRKTSGRYEIGIAEDTAAWKVTFGLERYPAEEIGEASRTAQPLPHAVQVMITYGADVLRQLPASEVADDPSGTRTTVTFRLTHEERDGLLRAFQSDTAGPAHVEGPPPARHRGQR